MEINDKIKSFLINDFSIKVREHALLREKGGSSKAPLINDFLPELANSFIEDSKQKTFFIRDYLVKKDWAFRIYASYFTFDNNESFLLKRFPMFGKTNLVKREGLNLYKRDGWCTHVIVGLFISNICIPESKTPPTISIVSKDASTYFEEIFPLLFRELDCDDLLLYKIGTLIHDLGVIDGVDNHDKKGIKYVGLALEELGINVSWLKEIDSKWTIEEFTKALELFVGQHTLVSKVYSELGLKALIEIIISEFLAIGSYSKIYQDWVTKKSIITLALFLVGDIGSVREELLNKISLKKILESISFLNSIIDNPNNSKNDYENYGLHRMQTFLDIDSEEQVKNIIFEMISNSKQFLSDIGSIQRLDYLLTYTKQIADYKGIICFLIRLISILNDNDNWKKSEWREVNFSPNISMDWVRKISDYETCNWHDYLRTKIKYSVLGEKVIAQIIV
jgi:hypothetical protein